MATVTQDQLAEFAYKAALNNEESENCPTSYLGYIIPDEFTNGEESYEIWARAYKDGLEDAEFLRWLDCSEPPYSFQDIYGAR